MSIVFLKQCISFAIKRECFSEICIIKAINKEKTMKAFLFQFAVANANEIRIRFQKA